MSKLFVYVVPPVAEYPRAAQESSGLVSKHVRQVWLP